MTTKRLALILSVVGIALIGILFALSNFPEPEEPVPEPDSVVSMDASEPTEPLPEPVPQKAEPDASVEPAPEKAAPELTASEALADASLEIVVAAPAPNRPTGIEGYVYSRGSRLAGAQVSWRPSHDAIQVPPKWMGGFADDAVMFGPDADLTTENPFRPGESFPVRLGGGFAQFNTSIVRTFPTESGKEYELNFESRYLQGHNNVTPHLLGEGLPLEDARAVCGIDLTGQTDDPEAPTIEYQSMTDGPNNMWRRFRLRFEAASDTTSLWLNAMQHRPLVNIAWFDGITVRPVEDEEGDKVTPLLEPPVEPDASAWGFLGTVLTGGEGFYRIEDLQPGIYDVVATYPDLGSARRIRVRVEPGELSTVNLTLFGGEELRGTVRDAMTGLPVEDAVVKAEVVPEEAAAITSQEILRSHTIRTDDSGVFHFDDLLPDTHYRLTVAAPGFIPAPERVSLSGRGNLEIMLYREGGVTGIVVDRESGRPVPGAFVRVLRENMSPESFRLPLPDDNVLDLTPSIFSRVAVAETDEDGRFSTPAIDAGDYSVVALHHGRLSAADNSGIKEVRIEGPSDSVEVKLELERGGTLRGRVLEEESGDPVPDLPLGIRFLVPFLPSDINEVMTDSRELIPFRTRKGRLADLFISSDDVRESSPPLAVHFTALTDRAGRFEIEGIGRGTWYPFPQSDDYRLARRARVAVDPPGISEATVVVRLVPRIEGTVVDRNEYPVSGARVWWRRVFRPDRNPWTPMLDFYGLDRSDEEGRFSLRVLGEGDVYDLMASTVDGDMGVLEGVRVDDPDVTITVEPAGGIEGKLWLHPNMPMAGAKVRAIGGVFLGGPWFREARTDGDGSFRIPHLVDGLYTLEFEPWGGPVVARYGPVDVPHGHVVRDVEVIIDEHAVEHEPAATP